MAERARRSSGPDRPRAVIKTAEFQRWSRGLDPESRDIVLGAISRIVAGGPTKGRPHVDVIHGSRMRKLKEARIDRGKRVLFAFDPDQNVVMLVGGDKTGKWNRWYPRNIELAERLYADHERRLGKEPPCSRREAGRTPSPRSR